MRCSFFFEDEIAVDFIGDQDEIVAVTELGKLEDLLSGEYASQGILGIAEKEELCAGGDRVLHGIPVEDPLGILENIGHGNELKSAVTMDIEEGWVHRSACEEGLSRIGECPACQGKGGYKSPEVNEMLSGG